MKPLALAKKLRAVPLYHYREFGKISRFTRKLTFDRIDHHFWIEENILGTIQFTQVSYKAALRFIRSGEFRS